MQLQTHRHLSEFCTFGIGGPIDYFAEVKTVEAMQEAMMWAKERNMPYLVLGKGSNCLFSDLGFKGLVLSNRIDFLKWGDRAVTAGAGLSFALLGVQTARKGWSGLEFASGIPASVGGAIFMNAGASGRQTCDALRSVVYLHPDGTQEVYAREGLAFDYRISPFQAMAGVIVAASFALIPESLARQNQLTLIASRMKTQPLKEKSAGCVFRNPKQGPSAGALIDQCGLKGKQVGGARVSEVHANFIVNGGKASSQDVLALIRWIQNTVYEKTGVHLETEIRIVPHG